MPRTTFFTDLSLHLSVDATRGDCYGHHDWLLNRDLSYKRIESGFGA